MNVFLGVLHGLASGATVMAVMILAFGLTESIPLAAIVGLVVFVLLFSHFMYLSDKHNGL